MDNIALNGYSTLADLDYFVHKNFEDFCSASIRQDLNRGGANYSNKVIKRLMGMVWIASEMKRLNQPLLINVNITRNEANEWYLEAVVEVTKLKTCSSPRCHLRSHSLVCIKNHLFIVGIGPILNREIELIF